MGSNIRLLRRHWTRLGARDAQWAVLTHPGRRGARWTLEEFFKSGTDEITAVLARAHTLGVAVRPSRALDFGCGAGRLTQALAGTFDRVDAVDIARSMLREAARHVRSPRVVFHHNTAPDLRIFPDAAFSFIYTTLVLQHMPTELSRAYLGEFLRVLEPGGLLVFQVPSRREIAAGTVGDTLTRVSGRLPDTACRARIGVVDAPSSAEAGHELTVRVRVQNLSDTTWPALPDVNGRYRINLGNRWLHDNGAVYQRDDGRAGLSRDVRPGESIDVILYVHAPHHDGTYWLDLDLVQEDLEWFTARGSAPTRVRCVISGGLPAIAAPAVDTPTAADERPPFRQRHPTAFRLFRATGIRSAYWAWRRAADAMKHRRDRAINWWAGVSFAPRMEMHWLPRTDVEHLIAAHGGRLIDVESEMTTGGYESCRYWVEKCV
jgi:SAM-dependent methyltransferase